MDRFGVSFTGLLATGFAPSSTSAVAFTGGGWLDVAGATVATQLLGSILLLTTRWCWLGAGILSVFTAIATLIAHAFWLDEGAERIHQMATFLEHVAIIAGFAGAAILVNGAKFQR